MNGKFDARDLLLFFGVPVAFLSGDIFGVFSCARALHDKLGILGGLIPAQRLVSFFAGPALDSAIPVTVLLLIVLLAMRGVSLRRA